MEVIWGSARLQLPVRAYMTNDEVARVVRALWTADPNIMSVQATFVGDVFVETVVPANGSLDLDALQKRLLAVATDALVAST
jgi:hypothetical protein